MPPEAGHPAPLLKGFRKTRVLQPGGQEDVVFRLSGRDLSYFDAGSGSWRRAGLARARVGESSADVRQTLDLETGTGLGRTWVWLLLLLVVALLAICLLLARRSRARAPKLLGGCGGETEESEESESGSCEDSEGA
mmetsp:Transcript_66238/g.188093  ORF Transcript_66238/g.188093 Transcript_66238/m.188093 type:complete len:136 (+) Transcript_66238:3-410(+)